MIQLDPSLVEFKSVKKKKKKKSPDNLRAISSVSKAACII